MPLPGCRQTVLLACGWLLLCAPLPAGVIWLELGTSDQPALKPDGSVLTLADFGDLSLAVYDSGGARLGEGDLSGLDAAGEGHPYGVVHVGDGVSGQVLLQLRSDSAGKAAELGQGLAWSDDFHPDVDPDVYRVAARTLSWEDLRHAVTLTVVGAGSVPNAAESYAHGGSAQLLAEAHSRWEFQSWGGDAPSGSEGQNPLNLTVDDDKSLTVTFRLQVPDDWLSSHFGTTNVDLAADPDTDGYTTREEYENGTDPLDAQQTEVLLDLAYGWNLISLPLQPARGATLSDLLGARAAVSSWWWNPWLQGYEAPGDVKGRRGYWVFSLDDLADVRVVGQVVTDATLYCHAGWNAVGPVNALTPLAMCGEAPDWWYWDVILAVYRALAADQPVVIGRGYWIYTAADLEIENE